MTTQPTIDTKSIKVGDRCATIGNAVHGRFRYKTVAIYEAVQSSHGPYLIWSKRDVVQEATTEAKITRLANEYAEKYGLPVIRNVRHGSPVVSQC